MFLRLDTQDAQAFDGSLTRLAGLLGRLGDTDTRDVRRARAVGILADPQHALDLFSGADEDPTPRSSGQATVYLHLTADDLEPTGGAGTVEGLGAATRQLIDAWLVRITHHGGHVRVTPVLDLARADAVDRHDSPAWMREIVTLRDSHCVFPGCHRSARAGDLDHIAEYQPPQAGGPPGQTRPDNLAPLCRTHHRLKTFTSWTYRRRPDGSYHWTSPTGHHHTTTPTPLGPPPLTRPPRP